MANRLDEILRLLAAEMSRPTARVAIVSSHGSNEESTMIATGDAYLHLAYELVSLVMRGRAARASGSHGQDDALYDPGTRVFWSDSLRGALYEFPSGGECSVVGAMDVESHDQLLARVRDLLPYEANGWEADPQFDPPPLRPLCGS